MADETNIGNAGKEAPLVVAPSPNIIFVGTVDPPTKINNALEVIKLPKVDEQVEITIEKDGKRVLTGKPFYHKEAHKIVQLFGTQYKHFKPKG